MKRYFFALLIFGLLSVAPGRSQSLSAENILEKAIAFHDPNGNWESLQATFKVVMDAPDRPERTSIIKVDFPKQEFNLNVSQGDDTYSYQIQGTSCEIALNGSKQYTQKEAEQFKLSCERGNFMKDYYTYLYGLPMKLNDPGTNLDPKTEKKSFKGKDYIVLKATYDAKIGKDTWYFYFDPTTYAMEVYQFYHDKSKNDGEYIILKGLETIEGIKMPKTRAWYMNRDDKYLGTDTLSKAVQ